MFLIDKEQLLSDIVNLTMPLGISSKGVDATYMDGYLTGKAKRQLEIIDIINKQQKYKHPELEKPKKGRKFRAMTIGEHCTAGKTECKNCEYHFGEFYCDYPNFNKINRGRNKNKPYKKKSGKYIMIEVKE